MPQKYNIFLYLYSVMPGVTLSSCPALYIVMPGVTGHLVLRGSENTPAASHEAMKKIV